MSNNTEHIQEFEYKAEMQQLLHLIARSPTLIRRSSFAN